MLTKNFYNWVMAKATRKSIANGFVDTSGNTYKQDYLSSDSYERLLNVIYTYCSYDGAEGVAVGSGTTPASINDYKLESVHDKANFSIATPSAGSISSESDGVSWFASYTFTNTSTNNLVISEIGLYGKISYDTTATKVCLLDRTVLETPITIAPGESKQLTYTIRMNYPAT